MSLSIAELRTALERRTHRTAIDWPVAPGLKTGTEFDEILGPSGIPQGRLTEIFGGASSGKTSVALALLTACTESGSFAAYVDPARTFYAPGASDAGAALSRLLVVRPPNAGVARRAVDALVRCGACAIVIFDCSEMGDALRTHHCSRLAAQAEKTSTALVVLSNGDIPALASFASLRLHANRLTPLWQAGSDGSGRLSGCVASLETVKCKTAAPGRSAAVRMALPSVAGSWPVEEFRAGVEMEMDAAPPAIAAREAAHA